MTTKLSTLIRVYTLHIVTPFHGPSIRVNSILTDRIEIISTSSHSYKEVQDGSVMILADTVVSLKMLQLLDWYTLSERLISVSQYYTWA